jgi:hypothetical protein
MAIPIGIGVAQVAELVAVEVGLVLVGLGRAVVGVIVDAIVVVVGIARVA